MRLYQDVLRKALGYSFLVIILLFTKDAAAQIYAAPDLNCATTNPVNGDVTLQWELPSVSCGPFVSYDIYASNNINGPYSLLTSVINPAATSYVHIGANGNVTNWFYYMQSNYNCPGEVSANSDTLSNKDPEAPVIQFVTVTNGFAELNWVPSVSAKTYAYIIYRFDGGFSIIDTVYGKNTTSYTDLNGSPTSKSEIYTIAAMDSCGNVGPFYPSPHQTIYLTSSSVDNCKRTISLNWTQYLNWPDGVKEYSLYYSKNGAAYVKDATVSSSTTSHTFTNINDGDSICLYVEGVNTGGNFFPKSNVICRKINVSQGIDNFHITNATVTASDQVQVEWTQDTSADIKEFTILRSTDSTNFTSIATIPPPVPLPAKVSYIDNTADVHNQSYYYRVKAVDVCDVTSETGKARTIVLRGLSTDEFENQLAWNLFEITYGQVDDYDIFFRQNNVYSPIHSTLPTDKFWQHDVRAFYDEAGNFCYYVAAEGQLLFPDNTTDNFTSSSNRICVNKDAIIRTPTAMAPEGVNNFFRPVILFDVEGSYTMQIFNRWGEMIFETKNINEGWDGSYQGNIVQQGVYAFFIKVQSANGEWVEKKGTVMVIR